MICGNCCQTRFPRDSALNLNASTGRSAHPTDPTRHTLPFQEPSLEEPDSFHVGHAQVHLVISDAQATRL